MDLQTMRLIDLIGLWSDKVKIPQITETNRKQQQQPKWEETNRKGQKRTETDTGAEVATYINLWAHSVKIITCINQNSLIRSAFEPYTY